MGIHVITLNMERLSAILKYDILYHVDLLLGNEGEISNGSSNTHVSSATIALQQMNGLFYVVRADMI
jgi:hypothetical protein